MQDSSARLNKVTWEYATQSDSTFGVGVSDSPTKGYTEGGSFTITNSMGGSGGFTAGPGFNRFVYGHFFRQRYQIAALNPICSPLYMAKFVSSVGDSFAPRQRSTPRKDPYRRCRRDPHGLATVNPHGHWDQDRGKAVTYSAAATIFNLSVSGSTGYTNTININYQNNSNLGVFVCGNAQPQIAPILWSNNSQGR